MPGIAFYKCRKCGADREVVAKSFFIGPLPPYPLSRPAERAWLASHLISFVCDADEVELTLPRRISLPEWEKWRSGEKASQLLIRFPFLLSICAHIKRHLDVSPELEIDYGIVGCPYCGMKLEGKEGLKVACTRCGESSMALDGAGMVSLNRDWPPIPPSARRAGNA